MRKRQDAISLRPAFTMIELLIVIVVIALLTTMILTVATRVVHNQKVALTQTIQQNTIIAIEEFATIDPLKAQYNTRRSGGIRPTFGPYPPYDLFGDGTNDQRVNDVLEPDQPARRRPGSLEERLAGDLYNDSGNSGPKVSVDDSDEQNDDIRSLYTYLKVKVPDALARVPDRYLKKMTDDPANEDLIDPKGVNPGSGSQEAFDILGIHDAWGVPMDYLLYVKLEASVDKRGVQSWRVVDRKPVLRSLGISRDEYDTMRKAERNNQLIELDDSNWIFSEPFPSPNAGSGANFWSTGNLGNPDQQNNGWARAISAGDAVRGGTEVLFGFLPDPVRDR